MTNLYPINQRVDFGTTLAGDVFARVFIKQKWADPWVERLDLIATQILWAAAPNTGSASIHRRYGPIVERDGVTHNRVPVELGGWYIKIVVTCPDGDRTWHGYVIDVGDEPGGIVTVGNVLYATGKQTWSCVGMLAALDRDTLRESIWYANAVHDSPPGSLRRKVDSAPHFNPTVDTFVKGQRSPKQFPNRRLNLFHVKDYFAEDEEPSFWTPRLIIRYLVDECVPKGVQPEDPDTQTDAALVKKIPLRWDGALQVPDWGRPELNCEGLTLKQCLDRLCNPSTGLGYWVWVDEAEDPEEPDEIVIQTFTLASSAVTVTTDPARTLDAAEHITDLFCGNDPATAYTVQSSLATRYNRVRVVGAKKVIVLTRRFDTDNFKNNWTNGWTTEEEELYYETWPVTPTTNPLDAAQRRRDLLEEGTFQRLYRYFSLRLRKLSRQWNSDGVEIPNTFPFGETEDGIDYHLPSRFGMRILPDLPLKHGVDYYGLRVETDDVIQEAHRLSDGARRPIAVYGIVHNLAAGVDPGHDPNNARIDWANRAHVDLHYNTARPNYQIIPSPYEDGAAMGLRLDVSGAWQGVLAPPNVQIEPFIVPRLDPLTLAITMAIEEDRRAEAIYPDDLNTLPELDSVLELRLEAGDGYKHITLTDGAIVSYGRISQNTFDHMGRAVVLEDDTDELGNIARLAWEWYSRTRSILRLATRRPTARLWPGVLVRELNPDQPPIDRQVNTTITEIALTLPTNEGVTPGAPQMEIVTSTGDVDFVRYVPRLRV